MSASGGKQQGFSPEREKWKASTATASGSDRHDSEASVLSVEASREEADCVWTLVTVGLSEQSQIELEIRRVLLPPTAQICSSVLGPGAVDCPECDAVWVGQIP